MKSQKSDQQILQEAAELLAGLVVYQGRWRHYAKGKRVAVFVDTIRHNGNTKFDRNDDESASFGGLGTFLLVIRCCDLEGKFTDWGKLKLFVVASYAESGTEWEYQEARFRQLDYTIGYPPCPADSAVLRLVCGDTYHIVTKRPKKRGFV